MVKVSKMTGKLSGLLGINFNPLDNEFCAKQAGKEGTVCEACYSRRMLATFRKMCVAPFTENAKLMSHFIPDQELPRFPVGATIRFLAHGELQNATQAMNFVRIANANPASSFAIWTKRMDIFQAGVESFGPVPDNLQVIQSSPVLNKKEDKHDFADKVFTVYTEEELMPQSDFPCVGNHCADCEHCYAFGGADVAELLRK
jgi:hypothetical protein